MKRTFVEHYKYLKRIHFFIEKRGTGAPIEFAEKIGVSVATLYRALDELKTLGAEINYCYRRRSYFYDNSFSF